MEQGEAGLQIYVEQVEQEQGGLQIDVEQVEQGQGVCPAEPLHLTQSGTKAVKDSTMQMYCTSLEPKHGLGQGADLGIPTVMEYTIPQAKSLYDIGVRVMSAADITKAMLADFISMKGGSIFDATQVDSLDKERSESNPNGGKMAEM